MEREPIEVVHRKPPEGVYFCHLISYVQLSLANKRLSLAIDNWGEHVKAQTRINSRRFKTRVEGATTALYQKAFEIMQSTSDNLGVPIVYQLRTKNRKMISWAQDPKKGRSVFKWYQIGSDEQFPFIGTAIISPKGAS